MPDVIQIITDRLPHSKVRGNARVNHFEKANLVAAEKRYMWELILANDPNEILFEDNGGRHWPFKKARATFNYWNPREIDWDNFLIGCKAWMDAIVKAGILVDDKPSVLSIVLQDWHKCKRGDEKVVIEIEERTITEPSS